MINEFSLILPIYIKKHIDRMLWMILFYNLRNNEILTLLQLRKVCSLLVILTLMYWMLILQQIYIIIRLWTGYFIIQEKFS